MVFRNKFVGDIMAIYFDNSLINQFNNQLKNLRHSNDDLIGRLKVELQEGGECLNKSAQDLKDFREFSEIRRDFHKKNIDKIDEEIQCLNTDIEASRRVIEEARVESENARNSARETESRFENLEIDLQSKREMIEEGRRVARCTRQAIVEYKNLMVDEQPSKSLDAHRIDSGIMSNIGMFLKNYSTISSVALLVIFGVGATFFGGFTLTLQILPIGILAVAIIRCIGKLIT
jgi:ElaB/YqjD/DUF883 family membrane-anchored ribosome-binding protein